MTACMCCARGPTPSGCAPAGPRPACADRGRRLDRVGGRRHGAPVRQQVTVLEREARLCARSVQPGVGASGDAARGQRRGAAAERRPARRGRIGRRPARGGTGGRLLDRRRRDRAGRGPRPTPALPAIAACWWTSVAAHRRRTCAAGDVAVSAPRRRPLRLESWQNAQDQGTAAALSALGLGKRIGRPARSGRSNTTPWCRSSAFRRWRPARCCGRSGCPRCCRWRWMRKAAPWRA